MILIMVSIDPVMLRPVPWRHVSDCRQIAVLMLLLILSISWKKFWFFSSKSNTSIMSTILEKIAAIEGEVSNFRGYLLMYFFGYFYSILQTIFDSFHLQFLHRFYFAQKFLFHFHLYIFFQLNNFRWRERKKTKPLQAIWAHLKLD